MAEIEKLEYPEIVRRRPGMFVGALNSPKVILREAIDNSIDELYKSKNTNLILVDVHDDKYIVQDNGRGIPIQWDDQNKCTKTELAVANLYAGSNFSKDEGTQAIGMNGVGVACSNALSTTFVVLSRITKDNWNKSTPTVKKVWQSSTAEQRKNLFYRIEFARGIKVKEDAGELWGLAEEYSISLDERANTIVYFIPDPDIFEETRNCEVPVNNFNYLGVIMKRYYKRSVQIIVNGHEVTSNFTPYKLEFERKIDLFSSEELYKAAAEKAEAVNKPINKSIWMYSTFEFSDDLSAGSYEGSVNSLEVNSGVHINAVNSGIDLALRTKFNTDSPNLIRGLKIKTVLVAAEVIFDAQTKTRLVEIPGANMVNVTVAISSEIEKLIAKNKSYFEDHMKRVDSFNEMNHQLSSKKFIKQVVNSTAGAKFNSNSIVKLKDCYSDKRNECELFLVEGDSAGSTISDVRNPRIHAYLPLKGRPLNTMNLTQEQMLQNQEMKDIILSIGAGVDGTGDIRRCRYGKIICSADADADGGIITASLLAFFAKHVPQLIENGRVFVAISPLYIQGSTYIYPGEEDKLDKNKPFRRIKGIGELKGKDAFNVFFGENTRKLVQVTMEGADRAIKYVDKYDPTLRRELMVKLNIVNQLSSDIDIKDCEPDSAEDADKEI